MTLVRCMTHKPADTSKYVKMTEVMNPPNEAIACGVEGCLNRGRVWLTAEEAAAYEKGQRYFPLFGSGKPGNAAEVIARIGVIALG